MENRPAERSTTLRRPHWSEVVNQFPKQHRIKRGDDFSDIIRHGAFAADEVLVVNVRRSATPAAADNPSAAEDRGGAVDRHSGCGPKLGISIPRKTGSAVVRNRWKRWIREAFRTQRSELPSDIDIIVRPKRDAVGSYTAVAKSLRSTTRRAEKKLRR